MQKVAVLLSAHLSAFYSRAEHSYALGPFDLRCVRSVVELDACLLEPLDLLLFFPLPPQNQEAVLNAARVADLQVVRGSRVQSLIHELLLLQYAKDLLLAVSFVVCKLHLLNPDQVLNLEEQVDFRAIYLNQSSSSLGPDLVLPSSKRHRASLVEVASIFRMKLLDNFLKSKKVALFQFMSLIQNLLSGCLHLLFALRSRELVCLFNLDNSFNVQTSLLHNEKAFGFCTNIEYHFASHDAELTELSIKISHFFEGPVFGEGERLDVFEPLRLLVVRELKRKLNKI